MPDADGFAKRRDNRRRGGLVVCEGGASVSYVHRRQGACIDDLVFGLQTGIWVGHLFRPLQDFNRWK
jgi:hypothetical protein